MSDSVTSSNATSNALFQPSASPRASAGSVLLFLVSAVFIFGGFWVMSVAFDPALEFGALIFAAGLALDVIGFWIAFGINPRHENNA